MTGGEIIVNDERFSAGNYLRFHRRRIAATIAALEQLGGKRIVELGGHPWAMTSSLIDDGRFEIAATVSAEEVTHWPDDIGVTRREYQMTTLGGRKVSFPNYSANIERTRFS